MKKELIILGISMFAIGFGVNNLAMSKLPSSVAVVDINQVVSQSSQVMALKKEQSLKMEELQKWLEVARADVEKQQTQEGKTKLIKKYDNDYAKKQETLQKDYSSKLQSIEKDISAVIANEAKENEYDLVLSKGVVLYGGQDITKTIAKKVK